MDVIALKPVFNDMPRPVPAPTDFENCVLACADAIRANRGRGKKTYSYIRFFQDYDGEILETIYAVKWVKGTKKTPEYAMWQLAFAGTPTRRWTSGNLLYGRLCGWFMLWNENDRVNGYVSGWGYDLKMYRAHSDTWRPSLGITEIGGEPFEEEASIRSLGNWPIYLNVGQMMSDCSKNEILAYVRSFIDHKDLELLQKAGISYLWNEKRLLNAKPNYRKRLLTYIRKNINDIRMVHPSLTFIINAMNNDMTIHQYEWFEVVQAVEKAVCGIDGFFMREEAPIVAKYLQKQNGGPIHYRDYLELSQKMGRDITSRGVLFPKDFCKQFDALQEAYQAEQSREMEERIKSHLEELNLPICYDHKGFSVRILDTQKSMTEIGNELHNCVGVSGYGMKMANGEVVVLAVYWNGRPLNCVELSTPTKGAMYRIQQNRGDHNHDSEMQKEVSAFLEGYIRKANKAWRINHACA